MALPNSGRISAAMIVAELKRPGTRFVSNQTDVLDLANKTSRIVIPNDFWGAASNEEVVLTKEGYGWGQYVSISNHGYISPGTIWGDYGQGSMWLPLAGQYRGSMSPNIVGGLEFLSFYSQAIQLNMIGLYLVIKGNIQKADLPFTSIEFLPSGFTIYTENINRDQYEPVMNGGFTIFSWSNYGPAADNNWWYKVTPQTVIFHM